MRGPAPTSARAQVQSHALRGNAWRGAKQEGAADAVDSLGQKGMRRSGRENANDAVRREARKRVERSGSPARTSSRAGIAVSGTGMKLDAAICMGEKSPSLRPNRVKKIPSCARRCDRRPFHCALRPACLPISERSAKDAPAACLDWSRFADAMAGAWPNDAMKAQQTGATGSARRHAGVMKPLDRRFGRVRRVSCGALQRNIIAIHPLNDISAYF